MTSSCRKRTHAPESACRGVRHGHDRPATRERPLLGRARPSASRRPFVGRGPARPALRAAALGWPPPHHDTRPRYVAKGGVPRELTNGNRGKSCFRVVKNSRYRGRASQRPPLRRSHWRVGRAHGECRVSTAGQDYVRRMLRHVSAHESGRCTYRESDFDSFRSTWGFCPFIKDASSAN